MKKQLLTPEHTVIPSKLGELAYTLGGDKTIHAFSPSVLNCLLVMRFWILFSFRGFRGEKAA